ncbi:MAG: hypothetical protein ABSG85_20490, partial [Spirochaetia bacterium]
MYSRRSWRGKARLALLVIFLAATAACRPARNQELAATNMETLTQTLHNLALQAGSESPQNDKRIDSQLEALSLSRLGVNGLCELRNAYMDRFVAPQLDDAVTLGLDRQIQTAIGQKVAIRLQGSSFVPSVVYVIVRYNPTTYEGQLESTYADDSLHLGEFPESYEGKTVQYRDGDRLQIVLDKGFHFDVGPRYYADHTWRVGSLEKYQDSSFNIPSQL